MKKLKIAITGGIGSGKTLASKLLFDMGFPVFSCDEIYKTVISSQEYIEQIQLVFPEAIIENKINRQILSKIVFNDNEKLERLNQIAHPLIMKELLLCMENVNSNLVFAEVPLLFEGNFENIFDKIIVIMRNERSRIENLKQRDSLNTEQIKRRMQAQFDYNSKKGRQKMETCNAHIIQNNGTMDDLKNNLNELIAKYIM